MLPTDPGKSATVLVAFACRGGMPSAISAGKVSKVPPPAMEFMTPAIIAAMTANVSCEMDNVADGCGGRGGTSRFRGARTY